MKTSRPESNRQFELPVATANIQAPVHPAPSESEPILVEISAGELLDKISILRIKRVRVKEPTAVANVMRELSILEAGRDRQVPDSPELHSIVRGLEEVNTALWQTEDDLRICEQKRDFGPAFVELARSVYQLNDRRAALKRRVNAITRSRLVEEKVLPDYQAAPTGSK